MFIGKILISFIIRMWLLGYVYTNILMFGCNNEKSLLRLKIEILLVCLFMLSSQFNEAYFSLLIKNLTLNVYVCTVVNWVRLCITFFTVFSVFIYDLLNFILFFLA